MCSFPFQPLYKYCKYFISFACKYYRWLYLLLVSLLVLKPFVKRSYINVQLQSLISGFHLYCKYLICMVCKFFISTLNRWLLLSLFSFLEFWKPLVQNSNINLQFQSFISGFQIVLQIFDMHGLRVASRQPIIESIDNCIWLHQCRLL